MRKSFLFAFLIFSHLSYGAIIESHDLISFEEEIERIDNETLVIFDVDRTLIIPKDHILRVNDGELIREYAKDMMKKALSLAVKNQNDYFFSLVLQQMEFELVNEKFPSLIQQLNQKGVKTIALTAMPTGEWGCISNVEDWRVQSLRKFGIDFSSAFPEHTHLTFKVGKKMTQSPSFKDGILFSASATKGETLSAFLKKIHWTPKKIIFLDDRMKYLQSVENAAKALEMDYLGIHYLEAKKFPVHVNPSLAKLQAQYLLFEERWLSDEEARFLLLKSSETACEKWISVKDGSLYALKLGRGDPTIVLHGGPGMDHSYILPQLGQLLKNSCQLIFYDQRGCGESKGDIKADLIHMDQYIEDLEQVRLAFQLEKMNLIAHSWGGLIGICYASKYPERVNKLVLMNSYPTTSDGMRNFSQHVAKKIEPLTPKLQELALNPGFAEGEPHLTNKYYRTIFSTYCANPQDSNKITLQLSKKAHQNGMWCAKLWNTALLSKPYDLTENLKKIRCPTLVVTGTCDPISEEITKEIHKNIDHSELVLLQDSGHFPFVEQPESLAKALYGFL